MNPNLLAAVVADALAFPTELDNTFSDADTAAREAIDAQIAEMNEAAEVETNMQEFLAAAQDYIDLMNRAMSAYEVAECNRDHETALIDMEAK